jgi:hypothetical protein
MSAMREMIENLQLQMSSIGAADDAKHSLGPNSKRSKRNDATNTEEAENKGTFLRAGTAAMNWITGSSTNAEETSEEDRMTQEDAEIERIRGGGPPLADNDSDSERSFSTSLRNCVETSNQGPDDSEAIEQCHDSQRRSTEQDQAFADKLIYKKRSIAEKLINLGKMAKGKRPEPSQQNSIQKPNNLGPRTTKRLKEEEMPNTRRSRSRERKHQNV